MPINGKAKKIWKNYVKDQVANPLKYFKPQTLLELIDIINDAAAKNYKVKAIGSGHSSSDIALTRDYMIDTHGLKKVLNISQFSLNEEGKKMGDNLWFVECGIILQDLIDELEQKGKGLENMGGYTGQTLAGAISTSTHGSGVTLGTVSEFTEAIILVTENGKVLQIERTKGISEANKPANLGNITIDQLIQDDTYFNAVVVSMGCMGVIYAVAYRVRNMYNLEETRSFEKWEDVRTDLNNGILNRYRHYEVLVNPCKQKKGKYKGHYQCLVTKRNETNKKPYFFPRRHRKILPELFLTIFPDVLTDAGIRFLLNTFPKVTPGFLAFEINLLSDTHYVNKYYKVLNIGNANNLAAFAMELSFPKDKYIEAVEEIINIVNKSVVTGEQYLMSPFSLRFVKTNNIFLSMQYSSTFENPANFVCMIEFPTLSGIVGGVELLERIEFALYKLNIGTIPHWGQVNHLGGDGLASLPRLYPKFNDWMDIYHKLSPKGMFQNDFTERCNIV